MANKKRLTAFFVFGVNIAINRDIKLFKMANKKRLTAFFV